MQKRVLTSSGSDPNANNLTRFYNEDAPGIKITPKQALFGSLAFICIVLVLHILGKIVGLAKPSPVVVDPSEFASTGAADADAQDATGSDVPPSDQ